MKTFFFIGFLLLYFPICGQELDVTMAKNTSYDSVKTIIKRLFPNGIQACKFNSPCLTDSYSLDRQQLNYEYGNIAFYGTANEQLTVDSDSITIRWKDPKKSTGRYFIEVTNIFDEVIDYKIANSTQCTFDLNPYKEGSKHPTIFLQVASEDCTTSSKLWIKRQ